MARIKNALTSYFVAPVTGEGEVEYMELAKWISSVTDASEENSEETGFYDGDGNPTTDVLSRTEKYTFEGVYDDEDPAMKFIAGLKREVGEGRKIMFKVVETNGDVVEGPATVTVPITSGGEATEYATFSCTIAYNQKPELTNV
ncbi:phage tail tube protein [Alkalihalobacillus trypoxylicola]|uniref:Phage tail protein n=1 Tax=Alkalihalobacillus trypoxylicola TaxID=519424 RepID=A0A161PDK5_9BACI|nr:hypothetical protein [Alkalihalobacillus trypoxylicola]KYG30424.1 phage tail protein [Alkalihalobacillus trypoxylicola]GAF65230.1 hypothetical protein BTS2_2128 [Bacillus sp. TS-2]